MKCKQCIEQPRKHQVTNAHFLSKLKLIDWFLILIDWLTDWLNGYVNDYIVTSLLASWKNAHGTSCKQTRRHRHEADTLRQVPSFHLFSHLSASHRQNIWSATVRYTGRASMQKILSKFIQRGTRSFHFCLSISAMPPLLQNRTSFWFTEAH